MKIRYTSLIFVFLGIIIGASGGYYVGSSSQINGLQTTISHQNNTILSLQLEKSQLITEVTGLQTDKNNLETQVNNLNKEKNDLNTQVNNLNSQVNTLNTNIETPTVYTPPGITVSAQYAENKYQNPGGPTIIITIQSSMQSQSIMHLSATLKHLEGPWALEGLPDTYYRTLEFPSVTQSSSLMPGDWVSQWYGWVGPSHLDSNVTLSGTFVDGEKFSVETTLNWIN